MALVGGGGERESEPREVFTHRGADRRGVLADAGREHEIGRAHV